MRYLKNIIPAILAFVFTTAAARQQLNFNAGWNLHIGDIEAAPSGVSGLHSMPLTRSEDRELS